jgi:hypothetical protein
LVLKNPSTWIYKRKNAEAKDRGSNQEGAIAEIDFAFIEGKEFVKGSIFLYLGR